MIEEPADDPEVKGVKKPDVWEGENQKIILQEYTGKRGSFLILSVLSQTSFFFKIISRKVFRIIIISRRFSKEHSLKKESAKFWTIESLQK